MNRNPPMRATEDLHLTLPRDLAQRAKANAQRLSFTLSEYVGALVRGQVPVSRPAADMQNVSLAGNRIVRAIAALQASQPNGSEALWLLREAHAFIVAESEKAKPAYEAAIAERRANDNWGDA